jgi:hypothetical protein
VFICICLATMQNDRKIKINYYIFIFEDFKLHSMVTLESS